MRFAVFGTGAVGGYFGARLAQAGHDVVFIARGAHLQKILKHGLKVDSLAGDFLVHPAQATDQASEVKAVDVVIVGVKTWQIVEAGQQIRGMLQRDSLVLPLQNGVDAIRDLSVTLGEPHVVGGLCKLIAWKVGPGHICHGGADPVLTFGELNNVATDRIQDLLRAFDNVSGVNANIAQNIQVELWTKFMLIAGWSGMGAITRSPVGVFRSQPETRLILEAILSEVHAVALAQNIPMPDDSVDACLSTFDKLPDDGTASMQRDIMDGLPSELDYQNGAVVRLGKQFGVSTPVNEFVYSSLLPMERRARGTLEFR